MSDTKENKEIDLLKLARALWHRMWAIIIAALIFGAGFFSWTYFMITPLYKSSALLYVNNSSFSLGNTSFSISNSELTAAQSLVDTYIVILNTRSTLEEVIKQADLDCTYSELKEKVNASAVNGTEVFSVTVTDDDPYEAEKIANTIATVLPEKIAEIVDGSDVRIVDYAVVPSHASSPNYTRNTAVGMVLGVVFSAAIIIVLELMDTFVRSEEYLTEEYKYPVLAAIPNILQASKNQPYYQKNLSADKSAKK